MIETVLFIGRILLVALLFLFLFTVMRTGVGLVKGTNWRGKHWQVVVAKGPREVIGLKMALSSPLVVGRAPGADILINAEYVSGRHARFTPMSEHLVVEDLGSTNGTHVNGRKIDAAHLLLNGDTVQIGDVWIQVHYVD
jgi:hypothetical protein